MARSDMSDLEWDFITQVLPNKSHGVKRVDDRCVINGIFYVLQTGIPWRDLPSEYRPPTTIYNRFNRGATRASEVGLWSPSRTRTMLIWSWWTARLSAPTIRQRRSKKQPVSLHGALSRGGLSTKLHTLTNQHGLPIRFDLTPVLANKAYDADWIREMIWEQGATDVILSRSNRKLPKDFDTELYKERNKIKRFFGRLKASFRRIASRYGKRLATSWP